MSMADIQRMVQQAQKAQQELVRVQDELGSVMVDGSAGGGVVTAVVTGKQELISVTIDPSAVDPGDVDMLQDLIVAAVNQAMKVAVDAAGDQLGGLTGGLDLGGLSG